jgi:hypothetical protein
MIPRLWKKHFLFAEGALAILLTACFAVWFWRFGGLEAASALLKGNRATLYGTIASIFGSLLGFVITATSIVLGFSASDRLAVVRESAQYPLLWKTFSATIHALAFATVVALLCLLVDRDSTPVPWLVVLLVLVIMVALLRVARTIWVLEKIIMLVTKPSNGR